MRSIVLLLALAWPSARLVAQMNAESAVRQALTQAMQGTYTSTEQKELEDLADASSVALIKIVSGKQINDDEIQPVLLVVRLSYNNPGGVASASEREPRATLFLLHSLDLSTRDSKLKGQIAAMRVYVEQQYAKLPDGMKENLPPDR